MESDVPDEIAVGQSTTVRITRDESHVGYSTGYVEIYSSSNSSPIYRFAIETSPASEGVPALIVGLEKRVLSEGITFSANVRRTGNLDEPLTVTLQTSDPNRLGIPNEIEFAAGEKWKRFDIGGSVDFDLRTSERSTLRAVANGYLP